MYPNLKAEMARNGVRQKQIAEVAGVSERTVFSWLSEHGKPDIRQAIKVKNSLFPSMSVEYLFASDETDLKSA